MLKYQIQVVVGCLINILASISMIFLNNYIFLHLQISTILLTAIQMLSTSVGLMVCLKLKTFKFKKVSIIEILPLAISFCLFVVFTNLSLEYNIIGTYQLFKVLTTPTVALISWRYYKIKYSKMLVLTLIPVIIGVYIHSVNDIKLTLLGTILAIIGILSTSLYQIWIGECLKDLQMDSQQLLFYQAPLSVILFIPCFSILESFPSYQTYEEQIVLEVVLITSSIVAFVVNLSVYWIIENTYVNLFYSIHI